MLIVVMCIAVTPLRGKGSSAGFPWPVGNFSVNVLPLSARARNFQPLPHAFGDVACQAQPQAGAVDLRSQCGFAAVERLENVREIRWIDSLSAIFHADAHARPILRPHTPHAHPVPLSTIFQGIQNQVLQAMRQGCGVRLDRRQIRVDLALHYRAFRFR